MTQFKLNRYDTDWFNFILSCQNWITVYHFSWVQKRLSQKGFQSDTRERSSDWMVPFLNESSWLVFDTNEEQAHQATNNDHISVHQQFTHEKFQTKGLMFKSKNEKSLFHCW